MNEKSTQIQTMFSRIARRYDLMNRVMTGGRDEAWRRIAAAELRLENAPAPRVIDLATGTGDLAFAVQRKYPNASIEAFDFSEGILRVGAEKGAKRTPQTGPTASGAVRPVINFGVADALSIPFPDHTFDGCINGFLLRNVVDLPRCLRELRRVVKPGGRVVCMEITHPQTPIFRDLFKIYFDNMIPIIGGIITGDPSAYKYLPNSLKQFPAAKPLKQMMLDAGYREVSYRLLGLGTMAVHTCLV
ncbi:MAG TPA: ubiquinone/menaquinone biosynthesis methyltransferase [Thermoflexales bacterium]|nr:ubiquinone/menaquinone biosynthesis methyltransferase [Thermoflexales bacterium]HQW34929.1 ubiquinone/menaquinone biosynthesis methyltransferase [Thermoflexales bacterium]HQX75469.1 ubiquinone/menaquinone biosynthesis methyltransferase [Thermoflexales bacterium]HQZ21081.1 ubiquinone/menaquinone biosynthesis methyltransferase [Thermoflexales bacterium]